MRHQMGFPHMQRVCTKLLPSFILWHMYTFYRFSHFKILTLIHRLWTIHKLYKSWNMQSSRWYLFLQPWMGSAQLQCMRFWLLWNFMPNKYFCINIPHMWNIHFVINAVCTPSGSCNSHGFCNSTDGSCVCDVGWAGASCDQCATNFYPTASCEICMTLAWYVTTSSN